jgi:hypothetical protein
MKGMDLDRGVTQKTHPNGTLIGMYKDAPGVYYSESGEPATEADAEQAGFDVRANRIKRRAAEAFAKAKPRILAAVRRAEERAFERAEEEETKAAELALLEEVERLDHDPEEENTDPEVTDGDPPTEDPEEGEANGG